MPTENRSINAGLPGDKLPPCADDVFKSGTSVCLVGDVPKHAAETICQSLSAVTGWKIDWHYIAGRTHIKALAPAEQHQGEPVATGFLLVSHPDGNQWTVQSSGKDHQRATQATHLKIAPLYTHADPGEVERLRTEIDQLRDARDQISTNYNQLSFTAEKRMEELEAMSAQLAEWEGLLRSALQDCLDIELTRTMRGSVYVNRLSDRIKSALTARAEPSAPASCTWTYNENSFAWDTTCNESFLLMDDGPKENCMKFCCYCSKPIIQASREAES